MSSDFKWDLTREEQAQDLMTRFDIREARRLIAAYPRPVEQLSVARYGEFLRSELETVRLRPADQRGDLDLTLPVIFARQADGYRYLIDGRHRVAVLLEANAATIPAVTLTAEETQRITIFQPPAEGTPMSGGGAGKT